MEVIMNNYLLLVLPVLLGIVVSVTGSSARNESTLFRKCCPENFGILRIMDEYFSVSYRCISREDANKYVNGSAGVLVVGSGSEVEYGFPAGCMHYDLVEEDYRAISYSPHVHCLDKIIVQIDNGTAKHRTDVIALSCERHQADRTPGLEMERIYMCCPEGQAYDTRGHVCLRIEANETDESLLHSFLGNDTGLYDIYVGLECKKEQSSIVYTEEKYMFEYKNSRLFIHERESQDSRSMWHEEYCVGRRSEGAGLVVRGCSYDCPEGMTCVRKCCPPGQKYEPRICGRGSNKCVPSENPFTPTFYKGPYMGYKKAPAPGIIGLRSPPICKEGRYALKNNITDDEHFLLYSGELMIPKIYKFHPTEEYCLETVDRTKCGMGISVEAVLCFQQVTNLPYKFTISFIGISISCVFLVLTLVVYAALPELRNLHGMTLMCHVSAMLLGYGCLARVQFGHIEESTLCKVLGYVIYLSFVAAFSWLCVMCFDIWWTFGSLKTVQRMGRPGADRRRFFWYSLCAWGAPTTLTVTMLVLDLYPVSNYLDANIGKNFCWFGSIQNDVTDWPHYIFLVVPLGLVTGVNLILWICTARHCARVKSELHRMQAGSFGDRAKRRFQADRAKYTLVVKLWVVMGASWIWEVLSTIVQEPRWLWLGIDLINELQGFFIFAILVLKPKVFFLVRKKLGLEKSAAQKTGAVTTSTRSTFLSTRSVSTDERAQLRVSQLVPALERLQSVNGKTHNQ